MRIDLPSCSLKSCRYCNDGNCTDAKNYEDCILRDMIQIPQNATNGDVIMAMFPNTDYEIGKQFVYITNINYSIRELFIPLDWWDAPFKDEPISEKERILKERTERRKIEISVG